MNKLQYKLRCMICYITKSRVKLNYPLLSISLSLKLLIVYAIVIAFVFSHSSASHCQFIAAVAAEYTLFCTSVKSPSLYMVCSLKSKSYLVFSYCCFVAALWRFVCLILLPCIVNLSLLWQCNTFCFELLSNCCHCIRFAPPS